MSHLLISMCIVTPCKSRKPASRFRPSPPPPTGCFYLYLGRLTRVGVFPLLLYCAAELCRAEFCKAELTMASLVSYSPLLASSFTTFSFISRSRPSAPRSRTTRLPYSCPMHNYIIIVLLSCTLLHFYPTFVL